MNRIILCLLVFIYSCTPQKQVEWTSLWNGEDFSGWHTYLGTLNQKSVDADGNEIKPFGLDNDPNGIITVAQLADGSAIRISGQAWGMIFTEQDYKNYHLKLKVKWGEERHAPRAQDKRDSGLLYHGFGEPGSAYSWMPSQELQIQEGDMGDYWPVGNVEIDIPSVKKDSVYYIYKEGAPLRKFYFADLSPPSPPDSVAMRRCFKSEDAEKPHGQWNDIELICHGDSSVHIVNGTVVMRLYNSRVMKSNPPQTVDEGKIILQSEGAEVFYKDIEIKPIESMPKL